MMYEYFADEFSAHFNAKLIHGVWAITDIKVEIEFKGEIIDITEHLKKSAPFTLERIKTEALNDFIEKKNDPDTQEFHWDGPNDAA